MKKEYLRQIVAVMLSMCMILSNLTSVMAESAVGTTLRLMKTEGEVGISNSSGKQISLIQDMKLYNGYHVETQKESYAWINLDSEKLTKLDAVSEAEIRQKGKELEILLNSGNLYFNVSNPLDNDETLNIRTSSMVVGIRGTAGWVKVINQWHSSIYVLEGTVLCSVTDPVSGQTKSAVVHAGEMADTFVYGKDKEGDKADIFINRYGRDAIDGFVLVELADDPDIQRRVYPPGGAENPPTHGEAQEKLKSDQDKIEKKLEEIEKELEQQESGAAIDPVWQSEPEPGNREKVEHRKSTSGRPTEPELPQESTKPTQPSLEETTEPSTEEPTVINLTMQVTDDEVDSYLGLDHVQQVIVKANPKLDNVANTLKVDSGINVPAGKTLTLETDVNMSINESQTVQVDGTLDMAGELQNSGNINVTSSNSLRVNGRFVNQATGTIYSSETGHIVAVNGVENYGSLGNYGLFEGNIVGYDGSRINISGGNFERIELQNSSSDSRLQDVTINELIVTDSHLMISGNSSIKHLNYKGNDENSNIFVSMDGGIVEKAEITAGSLFFGENTSVLELVQYGGYVGGKENISIEKLEIQGGYTWFGEGENVNANVKEVLLTGGQLIICGGTLKEIQQNEGRLDIIGGEVEKVIVTGGECNINESSHEDSEGNLIYTNGIVGELEQRGGSVGLVYGGKIKNGIRLSETADLLINNAILEAGTAPSALFMRDEAKVTIYEGSVDGSGKKAIQIEGGTLEEGGVVDLNPTKIKGSIEQNGGSMTFYKGILEEITQNAGELNIIGGETKKVILTGGEFSIGGNFYEDTFAVIEQIEQNGGHVSIKDDGGKVNNGIVVSGTGSFEMRGGTVEAGTTPAALCIKDNADVQLSWGIINGSDQTAIQIEGGNLNIGSEIKIRGNNAHTVLDILANDIEKNIIVNDVIMPVAATCLLDDETGQYYLYQVIAEAELENLLIAANPGETITLLEDATLENMVVLNNGSSGSPVILDLGTSTLTLDNGIRLNDAVWEIDGTNGGTVQGWWSVGSTTATSLLFNGGTYLLNAATGINAIVSVGGGNFVADGGAKLICAYEDSYAVDSGNGSVTINEAVLEGEIYAIYSTGNSREIVINDGAELSANSEFGVITLQGVSPMIRLNGGSIANYGAGYAVQWIGGTPVLEEPIGSLLKVKNAFVFATRNPENGAAYLQYVPDGYTVTGPDSDGYYSLEPETFTAALLLEEPVETEFVLKKTLLKPQDKDSKPEDKPLASSSNANNSEDTNKSENASKSQAGRKSYAEKKEAAKPEDRAESYLETSTETSSKKPSETKKKKQNPLKAAMITTEDKRRKTEQGRALDDEK
jgi:hypothetical protein